MKNLNDNKNMNSQENSSKENEMVVTRIAPSPTGVLHIGTARTALFNFLYAKKYNGKFIVRIEDTDKERSTPEFEKDIVDGLNNLGLKSDAFYRQSERTDIYQSYINKLIEEKKAYISKEAEGERSEVIRLKNPNKKITFNDMIRGDITFDTSELGDFVIAKSTTEPLYHLAVVIDDYEMKITHIIRGDDGISNTPRQILIQEAIGAPRPKYAHLPLILGKDKSKLSKRHGATSLNEFWKKGYQTEAIINQLAMLGWNPGTEKEIFSLEELIKEFSLEKIQKGGAIFNEEKLNWFNHQYLKNISDEKFLENALPYFEAFSADKNYILKLKNLILERISIFADIKKMIEEGELGYFFNEPIIQPGNVNEIIWKKSDKEKTINHLTAVKSKIETLSENISENEIKNLLWGYAEENGKGDVLWPLRYSLTGVNKSPDPFTIISIIGKEKTINRVEMALKLLNN